MEGAITFDCLFLECGRKFFTDDLLLDHVRRRHPEYYKDRYEIKRNREPINSNQKNSNKILDDLDKKIKEIEKNNILQNVKIQDEEIKLNINNIENLDDLALYNEDGELGQDLEKANNDTITDEMLLIGGKYFNYEEIDEVMKNYFYHYRK